MASEIILQAIRWIAEAWKKVQQTPSKNALDYLVYILDSNFELRSLDALRNGEDPFEDCDVLNDDTELTDLISRVQVENSCSVKELIHGEDIIPVCGGLAGDSWDEAFFSELGPVSKH